MKIVSSAIFFLVVLSACSQESPESVAGPVPFQPGIDGEGSAVIVSAETITADELTSLQFEFTVGESGIPAGGGIALGLHHSAEWPLLQTSSPDAMNYVEVAGPDHAELALSYMDFAPPAMFENSLHGLGNDAIFRKILLVSVQSGRLLAEDKLMLTLGGGEKIRAPKSSQTAHEFRFTTDADADGIYLGIGESPTVDITAGDIEHFSAAIPAQVEVGKPFSVLIRAEDRNFNIVESYAGSVSLRDEQGKLVLDSARLTNGLAYANVVLDSVGPHRLRIEDAEASVFGRSNPARSFLEMPAMKLFWGDVHGHTSVSDGLGENADDYFRYGRDIGGLDVLALTDHGHFDWPANVEAVQNFYEPGNFVTVLAQEAGALTDHMNVYFRRDDTDHIARWQNDIQAYYTQIYQQYNSGDSPEAMTGPHHFSFDRGDDRYPFGVWDDRTARFVEVYSSHGTSEFPGNARSLANAYPGEEKYMQHALSQGMRFGVIGASDNHDSKPGRSGWGPYPGGLAGFWATDLTRESVWEAMWNYQVYATSMDRIYLEFSIDDQLMGSELETGSPVRLQATIIGKTDNLMVAVIRDNETVHEESTVDGVIELNIQDDPAAGQHFYYLRVTQDNGERAWSTPVWVNRY